MIDSAKLLAREKIFDNATLPYVTQLIPLAAICAVLGNRYEEDPVKRSLCRWYWCGVFGELYGGANETRFAYDMQDVLAWLDGGDEPRTDARRELRPDPPAHTADPPQRRVQGANGSTDAGWRQGFPERRPDRPDHLLRHGRRHSPHLPTHLLRAPRIRPPAMEQHRE